MAGKDAAALGKMDPELAALLKTIPVVPRIETDDIPTSSRMLSETPPADGSPLIIFSRGGGFCLDGLESEEMSCRLFADEFGAANLAPTYLQICGMDPLHDEAIMFERRLGQNGTKTKIDVFAHNFWTAFPTINFSKKFIQDTAKGMELLLRPAKMRTGLKYIERNAPYL